MLYYTILFYTVLYYTILYYTILYYTIPYYTILYYTMLCYIVLCNTILGTPTPLCGHSRGLWCSIVIATDSTELCKCRSLCVWEMDHAGRYCCFMHHPALRHQKKVGDLESEHGRAAEEAAPLLLLSLPWSVVRKAE